MMETKNQRRIAIDALRVISILAVVLIHTTTRTVEASSFALQKIPFTLFLNQAARFAVPLFFLISGFVLELSYHARENYLQYLKRRLSRVFIPYFFWSIIYYYFIYVHGRDPSFLSSLLWGNASYQLYFIPTLLIFYLVFPLVHKLSSIIGNIWVIIFLFLTQIVLVFNDYNGNHPNYFYPLAIATLNYFPFIFGFFLAKNYGIFINFINKWKLFLFSGTIILSLIVFREGFNGYLATHNYLTFYSQWRPSVLIYTIFLGSFLYWFFNRNTFDAGKIKLLSKLSFFVFFIHVIMLEIIWYSVGIKFFQLAFVQNLWWDLAYFIAVTSTSFLIAYIIHKIPYLSKLTG